MTDLTGKVAIVAGAGQGMGQATALALAKAGANVMVGDIAETNADMTVEQITAAGGNAVALHLDVTSENDWEAILTETIATFDHLDILVNAASVSLAKDYAEITLKEWRRVLNVNTTGVFLGTQVVIPHFQAQKHGVIVNISSMAASSGQFGAGPYAASKGGVNALTKGLALDFAPDNIRVNSVHPGYIATKMNETLFAGSEGFEQFARDHTPLPILGNAADVANGVLFLVSDDARFITGIDLPIDGGICAQ